MSAEAPKPTGITASVTPREPQGCLPRFLRRFFAGISEPQPISQSKPNVIQPPLGLENLAVRIKQGIDDNSASIRQQVLDGQHAEAVRQAVEVNARIIAGQRQKELDLRRSTILAEGKKVLNELRAEEKLRYINDTQWGGMGKIGPVEPQFACNKGPLHYLYPGFSSEERIWDLIAGFELVYFYPAHGMEQQYQQRGGRSYDRRRNVPIRVSTKLQVVVLTLSPINKIEDISKVVMESMLLVKSDDPKPGKDFGVNGCGDNRYLEIEPKNIIAQFPVDDADRNDLLDQTLAKETLERVSRGNMPAQLESRGNQELMRLQKEGSTEWRWSVWYDRTPFQSPGHG